MRVNSTKPVKGRHTCVRGGRRHQRGSCEGPDLLVPAGIRHEVVALRRRLPGQEVPASWWWLMQPGRANSRGRCSRA